MKKIFLLFAIALIGLTACKNNQEGPGNGTNAPDDFLAMSNDGVYYKGAMLFEKNEELHQIAENVIRRTYRIQTDDQSQFVHFALAANVDKVDDKTTLSIKSEGVDNMESGAYDVVLSQIKDGKAWYWCKDKSIGFLIPSF